MFKKLFLGSWLLVAALVSGSASADSYFGFGLGNASWDLKPFFGTNELEDGTAVRLFGGTRTGNFGMEIEFSFSEHDWKGSGGLATHNAGGLIFSGVGYLGLAPGFDLYGKAGLNLWNTTVDFLGLNYDGEDGINLALGVGLDIAATEQFHIRMEYQMLGTLDDGVDEGDLSQLTINGAYFF